MNKRIPFVLATVLILQLFGLAASAIAVIVPDVVGMHATEAGSVMSSAKLQVDYVPGHNNSVPEGYIVDQSPAAGTSVPEGSLVLLGVSLGPVPTMVEVPDIVGLSIAEAYDALSLVGLSWSLIPGWSDTVPKGHIISQIPSAGTLVPEGSRITAFDSQGPPSVVPDVVGMHRDDALEAIESAGLSARIILGYSDTIPPEHVYQQSPVGGSLCFAGYTVQISIVNPSTVVIPYVLGMSEADAESELTSVGLDVWYSYESDENVEEGLVISQDPAWGTKVSVGSRVSITINRLSGGQPFPKPPVPKPPVPEPTAPSQPDPGCLVAHWKLDDGSGSTAIDSSGNGCDITLHNTTWEDGIFAGAIHFQGWGYADASFNYQQNAVTLCTWVRHDEFRIDKIERYVTVGPSVAVVRKEYDGRLHFYIGTDGNLRHLWIDSVITKDHWHHVAGTWDGHDQRLYIDGVEIAGQAPGGVLDHASHVVLSSRDESFNGMLDDVRIYQCALSENEIRAVMAGTPAGVLSDSRDIGTTGGSNFYENGVYTVIADGSNIWNDRDEFRYVYTVVTGDFELSAHILSLENTHPWAKAGVMVRESLETGARHAFMSVTPESEVDRFSFITRSAGMDEMSASFSTLPGQVFYPINTWVKISRQGNTFTGLISENGTLWEEFPGPYSIPEGDSGSNPVTIDMPETVYVGLAVTSHSEGNLCMAEFDNVVIQASGGADLLNPLSDALDTPLDFTTGGNADWYRQVVTSYYDGDAAQSGDISHVRVSWMQTTVTGPGTVSFFWKVSSEQYFDFLEFHIDGSLQDRISGAVDWHQKVYEITNSDLHTLQWRYTKDVGTDSGNDCGWVDKVIWTPAP